MENLSIALVSDFYLPDLGGVQLQIRQLACFLQGKARKVIVVTHCRPGVFGVKYVEGVKTYYLAWGHSSSGAIYPTTVLEYVQAKKILEEEEIDIIHTHQSSSTLGVSYALYGYHIGLKTVHTEHSLFQVRSNTYLHFSWLIACTSRLFTRCICVSRAVRNNLLLRAFLPPKKAIVIPNAVLAHPPHIQVRSECHPSLIRIVIVGRLVYRRGVDLLMHVLPVFCERNKDKHFRIEVIGDGPKMKTLRTVVQRYNLHEKVLLHGGLSNKHTLELVSSCHIFLSTALTESFGVALVQAARLGLHCVSTDVGGVAEILPSHRLHTVSPTPESIVSKLEELMAQTLVKQPEPVCYRSQDCFQRVCEVYQQVGGRGSKPADAEILDGLKKGSLVSVLLVIALGILTLIDGVMFCCSKIRRLRV